MYFSDGNIAFTILAACVAILCIGTERDHEINTPYKFIYIVCVCVFAFWIGRLFFMNKAEIRHDSAIFPYLAAILGMLGKTLEDIHKNRLKSK